MLVRELILNIIFLKFQYASVCVGVCLPFHGMGSIDEDEYGTCGTHLKGTLLLRVPELYFLCLGIANNQMVFVMKRENQRCKKYVAIRLPRLIPRASVYRLPYRWNRNTTTRGISNAVYQTRWRRCRNTFYYIEIMFCYNHRVKYRYKVPCSMIIRYRYKSSSS